MLYPELIRCIATLASCAKMKISGIILKMFFRTTVTYCKETQLKSTAIQGEVSELESDLDDGEYCRFTVVCCLQY